MRGSFLVRKLLPGFEQENIRDCFQIILEAVFFISVEALCYVFYLHGNDMDDTKNKCVNLNAVWGITHKSNVPPRTLGHRGGEA